MGDILTITQGIAHIRALTEDRDTAISDADLLIMINETGNWLYTNLTDRIVRRTHNNIFNDSNAGFVTDTFSKRTNATNYQKILAMFRETSNGVLDGSSGAELERVSVNDLYRMRRRSSVSGTPKFWCAQRVVSDPWRIMIHPPVASTISPVYLSAHVEIMWNDFTAADTSVFDLDTESIFHLLRIVAVQAASVLERSEQQIQALEAMLPRHIRSRMGILERKLGPRPPLEHAE